MTDQAPIITILPKRDDIRILFAHGACDMKPIFDATGGGIVTQQVSTYEELEKAIPEADVLVASGLCG